MYLVLAFIAVASAQLTTWYDTNNYTGIEVHRYTASSCSQQWGIGYFIPEEICVSSENGDPLQIFCYTHYNIEVGPCNIHGSSGRLNRSTECQTNNGEIGDSGGENIASYRFSHCNENYNFDNERWDAPDIMNSLIGGMSIKSYRDSNCDGDYHWQEYTLAANLSDWHSCHKYGDKFAKFECKYVDLGVDNFEVKVYTDEECLQPENTVQMQGVCVQRGTTGIYDKYQCKSIAQVVAQCLGMFSMLGMGKESDVYAMRTFRDNVLMKYKVGRAFVEKYYEMSPKLAVFLENHAVVKLAVRSLFVPFVLGLRMFY